MRGSRRYVLGAALLALTIMLGACGSGGDDTAPAGDAAAEPKEPLTVGAVAFAENQIVAEMYAQVLENAGYEVDRQTSLESREILQPAVEKGEIDIAPEYLGSLLLFLDQDASASGDPAENVSQLEPLLAENNITLLEPSAANDTNAFVVTQETASTHGLSTMSDLAHAAGDLTLGGPPECPKRPFCIPGLEETYGITFGEFKPLDVGGPITVQALKGGEIDVALLFSTSSAIAANGWVVLEDDKALQTAENITPVVNSDVVNDEIAQLLNSVSGLLTTENITELNGKVEIDQEDPEDVAQEFLEQEGLV